MACETAHRLTVPCAHSVAAAAAVPSYQEKKGGSGVWLNAVIAQLKEAYLRRQSVRELMRLRDQDLRDIGISRGEIDDMVDRLLRQMRGRR